MFSIWNLIAKFVTRPKVFAWLVAQAKKRPYSDIGDYMGRWWLVPELKFLPFAIRVHHILRADAEDDLHDHPSDYRSIILRGWYSEEDEYGRFTEHHAGSTRAASAKTLHRIDMVSAGGVWTLFIMKRRHDNRWGWMTGNPPRKMYWRDYIALREANLSTASDRANFLRQ